MDHHWFDREGRSRITEVHVENDTPAAAPTSCDITHSIEVGCWTALLLAPFLRWVNGPAVSTDQFVMQIVLIVVAAAGAIGLRIFHWRTRGTN